MLASSSAPADTVASPAAVALRRVAVSAIAVLAMTSVHHAYGAFVYATPWRLHALLVSVPAALLIGALLGLAPRSAAVSLAQRTVRFGLLLTVIVPFLLIGLFEGGYNHLLKNVLYFSGIDAALLHRLFPAPIYELPNDLVFEATGIAQFFLALLVAMRLRQLRARPPQEARPIS